MLKYYLMSKSIVVNISFVPTTPYSEQHNYLNAKNNFSNYIKVRLWIKMVKKLVIVIILLELLVQVKTGDLMEELRSFEGDRTFVTLEEKLNFVSQVLAKVAESRCEINKTFFSGEYLLE